MNPFPPKDTDRHAIWEMLVARDIAAFVVGDWSLVAGDFLAAGFQGIDARREANPDRWRLAFPTLEAYRDEWLRQARDFAATEFAEEGGAAIHRATTLADIEIAGDRAVARKKFDGTIRRADGGAEVLNWQTLYFCRRTGKGWKITGFVGYLPNPMGV